MYSVRLRRAPIIRPYGLEKNSGCCLGFAGKPSFREIDETKLRGQICRGGNGQLSLNWNWYKMRGEGEIGGERFSELALCFGLADGKKAIYNHSQSLPIYRLIDLILLF